MKERPSPGDERQQQGGPFFFWWKQESCDETKEPAMSWLRSKATPAVCRGCLSTPAAQRRNNAAGKEFRTSNSRLVSAHAATPGLKKHCFWCLYVVLLQVKTGYHWTPKTYLTWRWHCWWNNIYCCLLNSFNGTEWCTIVLYNMLMW